MLDTHSIIAAKERGAIWLEERQLPDGSYEPQEELLQFAYKIPWALLITGRTLGAAHLLDYVTRKEISPLGDFFALTPWGVDEVEYTYRAAWLVCGAQKLGRFDLARRGIQFLLSLQDAESGGIYSRRDVLGPYGKEEAWISSMVGLAALYTGNIREAEKVGHFLARVRALQPDFKRAFYFVYTPAIGLVTDFSSEEAEAHVIHTEGHGDQWYFHPGITAAFLSSLYLVTGDTAWLQLADDYLIFADRCPAEMYLSGRCGKVGWGAALLYHATGDERYLAYVRRVVEYLLGSQDPNGAWKLEIEGWPSNHIVVDVTAEFVVLLDEILRGLGGFGVGKV